MALKIDVLGDVSGMTWRKRHYAGRRAHRVLGDYAGCLGAYVEGTDFSCAGTGDAAACTGQSAAVTSVLASLQTQINRFATTAGFVAIAVDGHLKKTDVDMLWNIYYYIDNIKGTTSTPNITTLDTIDDTVNATAANAVSIISELDTSAAALKLPVAATTAAAGTPTGTATPWYKNQTTWIVTGGVLLVGLGALIILSSKS